MNQPYDMGALIQAGGSIPAPPTGVAAVPAEQQRVASRYLYSAYQWSAGVIPAANYDLFAVPLGQNGQGFAPMNEWCTNLETAGQVPEGESWVITHVGLVIDPVADYRDVVNFLGIASLAFKKRSMRFASGPAMFYPGGAGITGAGVSTTNPAIDLVPALSNGIPAAGATTRLPVPIQLRSSESFRWQVVIGDHRILTLFDDFIVWVKLYGQFGEAVPL